VAAHLLVPLLRPRELLAEALGNSEPNDWGCHNCSSHLKRVWPGEVEDQEFALAVGKQVERMAVNSRLVESQLEDILLDGIHVERFVGRPDYALAADIHLVAVDDKEPAEVVQPGTHIAGVPAE